MLPLTCKSSWSVLIFPQRLSHGVANVCTLSISPTPPCSLDCKLHENRDPLFGFLFPALSKCLARSRYSLKCVLHEQTDHASLLHTSAKIWKPDPMPQADRTAHLRYYALMQKKNWAKFLPTIKVCYKIECFLFRIPCSRITMASNSHLPLPHSSWLSPTGHLTHTLPPSTGIVPQETTSNWRRCLSFPSYLQSTQAYRKLREMKSISTSSILWALPWPNCCQPPGFFSNTPH